MTDGDTDEFPLRPYEEPEGTVARLVLGEGITFSKEASTTILCNDRGIPVVHLDGGVELALDNIKDAMREARDLIMALGTTDADYQWEKAAKWMKRYFPNWT